MYSIPSVPRFGSQGYGQCDNLDIELDITLSVPTDHVFYSACRRARGSHSEVTRSVRSPVRIALTKAETIVAGCERKQIKSCHPQ